MRREDEFGNGCLTVGGIIYFLIHVLGTLHKKDLLQEALFFIICLIGTIALAYIVYWLIREKIERYCDRVYKPEYLEFHERLQWFDANAWDDRIVNLSNELEAESVIRDVLQKEN